MFTNRPFIYIVLAFILGIIMEFACRFSAFALVVAFVLLMVLALCLVRWPKWATSMFLLSVVILAAFDYKDWITLPRDHVYLSAGKYRGQAVTVHGVVASDIQTRALGRGTKTSFSLEVQQVCTAKDCMKKSGQVMVNMFEKVSLRYGDEIALVGKLHRPLDYSTRGRLSYPSYLARQKIYLMLTVKKGGGVTTKAREKGNAVVAFALRCRARLNGIFDRYLSPAESGLMQALITGERKDVPAHVREIFFRTGTVHILSISGMNIGMVAFGVFLILNLLPIGRKVQMALTVMIIAFYSFMAGGNSPVVRAAVTGTVFLLGFLIEREQDMLNSLSFAALCIMVFNPNQLFDVGFQLSFGSVLSIILLTPIILRPLEHAGPFAQNRFLRWIAEAMAVSLAAIIGVSGLIAYYFLIVTPVAIFANPPVIPLVGIATALGCGLLVFGLLLPPLAPLFAVCSKVSLNLMALILYWFSQVPAGSFFIKEFSLLQVVIYYSFLVGFYIVIRLLIRYQARIWVAWQLGI